jgi:mono/diheme cytochrome c family protein
MRTRKFMAFAANVGAAWALSAALQAAPRVQTPSANTSSAEPRDVLDRYCVTCHNERVKAGGLMLDCPVSGGVHAAEKGEGSVMGGGDAEAFERVVREIELSERT